MTEVDLSHRYRIVCEGVVVGHFDTHDDAQSCADGWNFAYPPPAYPQFTVDPPCADVDCGYCGS